jgi:hypothetical protein
MYTWIKVTLHAPQIIGLLDFDLFTEANLLKIMHDGLDKVWYIVKERPPAMYESAFNTWKRVYCETFNRNFDEYSFIPEVDANLLDNHHPSCDPFFEFINRNAISTLAIAGINFVSQLSHVFQVIESLSPSACNWLFYLKIENLYGVSQIHAIIKWMQEHNHTFIITIDRTAFSSEYSDQIYIVQRALCEKAHQKDISVMITGGILASMESTDKPSVAEICDLMHILELGVNFLLLDNHFTRSQSPSALYRYVEQLIVEFIKENKAKNQE